MADPSILIVVPRGITKRAIAFGTRPEFSAHFKDTGKVAAELPAAKAVVWAGIINFKNPNGFSLVI
eukprot:scaffold6964_cov153-Cylindrotheca_fusiformis.AAC.1